MPVRATVMVWLGDAKAVQADATARQRGAAQGRHLAQVGVCLARCGAVEFIVRLAAVLHGVKAGWARPGDKDALVVALAGDLLKAVDTQHQLAASYGFVCGR